MKQCKIDGCGRDAKSKGMCHPHYSQDWNTKNRERYNKNWRKHYKKNAEKRRLHSADLKKLYGITADDYEQLLSDQRGVCAICGKAETHKSPIDNKRKRLAVDHCHETGKVRALLCATCNNGLGCFKDDPIRMFKAMMYLTEHQEEK